METLRSFSKKNFEPKTGVDFGVLNTGCLQRIADATELMAADHNKMKKDLEWYQKKYADYREQITCLHRSNAALKGHITRLKKRISVIHLLFGKTQQTEPEDVKQK